MAGNYRKLVPRCHVTVVIRNVYDGNLPIGSVAELGRTFVVNDSHRIQICNSVIICNKDM